jgi:hypothetical protein
MIPSILFAVSLLPFASSALGAPDASAVQGQDQALDVSRRAVLLAFEKGTPLIDTVPPMLERLCGEGEDWDSDPARARRRQQDARALRATLDPIRRLQAGTPSALQAHPSADARMLDMLAQTVNDISDVVGIAEPGRRTAIVDLYLSRWRQGARDATPQELARERRYAEASLSRDLEAQSVSQRRTQARLSDLGAFDARDGGADGSSPSGGFVRASAPSASAPAQAGAVKPRYSTLKIAPVPDLHPEALSDAEAAQSRHDWNPLAFSMKGAAVEVNKARSDFYNDPRNADRTNPALDEAEHDVGMYQLEQGFSRYVPGISPTDKPAVDAAVGTGAIVVYNVVFGVPLGLYHTATGEETGGLGMGGHFVVGVSKFIEGVAAHYQGDDSTPYFEGAHAEFASGVADISGDVKGTVRRLRDDVKNY